MTRTVSHLLPRLWREWICFWLCLPSKRGRASQSRGRASARQARRSLAATDQLANSGELLLCSNNPSSHRLTKTPFPAGGEEKGGVRAGLGEGTLFPSPPPHTHEDLTLNLYNSTQDFFFKQNILLFIYLLLERGEGREKEGENH